jgi:Putative zinc-finger
MRDAGRHGGDEEMFCARGDGNGAGGADGMTGGGTCAEVRHALGVYVLGAIGPADRAVVDGHLAWCRACREELAGLAALPALLGRVPAAEAARPSRGGEGWDGDADLSCGAVLPRLLGRAAGIRRARRRRGAAAAAALLVIGAGSGVAAQRVLRPAESATSAPVAWRTVSGHDRATLASATVSYAPAVWGTRLDVQVGGITPGMSCQLRVISSRGREVAAGAWTVARGHLGAWYLASAPFPASSVRAFEITARGKILVRVPAR